MGFPLQLEIQTPLQVWAEGFPPCLDAQTRAAKELLVLTCRITHFSLMLNRAAQPTNRSAGLVTFLVPGCSGKEVRLRYPLTAQNSPLCQQMTVIHRDGSEQGQCSPKHVGEGG